MTRFIHLSHLKEDTFVNPAFVSKIEWNNKTGRYDVFDAKGVNIGPTLVDPGVDLRPHDVAPAEKGHAIVLEYTDYGDDEPLSYVVEPVLAWKIFDNVVIPVVFDWNVNGDIMASSALGAGDGSVNLVSITLMRPDGKIFDLVEGIKLADSLNLYKDGGSERLARHKQREQEKQEAKAAE